MKFLLSFTLFFSAFHPLFAEGHKKFKKEEFDTFKLMKIEYLNKKINCVRESNNFKEMKKCWGKRKNFNNRV